jgi:MFS family permease
MQLTRIVTTLAGKTQGAISRGAGFVTRQERDWKVSAARSNLTQFFYRMVLPYLSIYTMALGATGTDLGLVNSIGMFVAGVVGLFSGWLMDRTSLKRIYLVGIVILAISYLIYGLAQSWPIIIVAMAAYWLGNTTSQNTCQVICGNCLKREERATGMAFCETFSMGILGFAAPMIGAWLVTAFGGVNAEGIRPLFFISLAGIAGTFFFILFQLSNRSWKRPGETSLSFLTGMSQVFKEGHNLRRWLVIYSITGLGMGLVTPFAQPFAQDLKGADQFVLGAMVTAASLVPLVFGIPMGRLADRIGRKKIIYATIPLVWVFYLLLIFAPNPAFLVVAGGFQGFLMITTTSSEALSRDLVPPEQMGRWIGVLRLGRMGFAALTTLLAGLIWDHIGPQYVFWFIMAFDLIRVPLLIGMPETLGVQKLKQP